MYSGQERQQTKEGGMITKSTKETKLISGIIGVDCFLKVLKK